MVKYDLKSFQNIQKVIIVAGLQVALKDRFCNFFQNNLEIKEKK